MSTKVKKTQKNKQIVKKERKKTTILFLLKGKARSVSDAQMSVKPPQAAQTVPSRHAAPQGR